jgi:hypothetical protein
VRMLWEEAAADHIRVPTTDAKTTAPAVLHFVAAGSLQQSFLEGSHRLEAYTNKATFLRVQCTYPSVCMYTRHD